MFARPFSVGPAAMTVFPRTGRTHCAAARGTVLAVAAAWGVLAPLREARAQETQSSAPRILSLSAAERAALEQQPQIRIARAQTAVAMATADEVRAPLLPKAP